MYRVITLSDEFWKKSNEIHIVVHDDVIKWKHFPRNWPFVREIHRSPVNFPHKGQWRGALMFSLNYAWINDWVNNREAGDLRRQHGHYDVIVMLLAHPRQATRHFCANLLNGHFSIPAFRMQGFIKIPSIYIVLIKADNPPLLSNKMLSSQQNI